MEFRDLAPSTASITVYCYVCTDDCENAFYAGEETDVVSGFFHKFDFSSPAPRTYKETLTIHSDAGFKVVSGKAIKLYDMNPSSKANTYHCGFYNVMCRNPKGEIVDDPGEEMCSGQANEGIDDETTGKVSKR